MTDPGDRAQPPFQHVIVHMPPTSAYAVWGFVLSLLWLCGLGSIAGLALGVIAIRECNAFGKRGKGLAVAAVVIGGIGTAFLALFVILASVGAVDPT